MGKHSEMPDGLRKLVVALDCVNYRKQIFGLDTTRLVLGYRVGWLLPMLTLRNGQTGSC